MVPWHPPCALISLIFSSLDPETNCCYFEVVLVDSTFVSSAITPYCNWPLLNLSCAVVKVQAVPAVFQQLLRFSVRFRTLKAIQTRNANLQQLPMRRCASTDLPRGNSACLATLSLCFIRPVAGFMDGVFDSFLSAFAYSARL